jgi:hypothetical protein
MGCASRANRQLGKGRYPMKQICAIGLFVDGLACAVQASARISDQEGI